jgi:hypothetical protein
MILKSENTRILTEFFAKQEIAEALKGSLLAVVKFCFEVTPINFCYHVEILHPRLQAREPTPS